MTRELKFSTSPNMNYYIDYHECATTILVILFMKKKQKLENSTHFVVQIVYMDFNKLNICIQLQLKF